MKIMINGRFLTHRVTGVERYAREIVAELDRLVKPGEMMLVVPPETKGMPKLKNIKVVKAGRLHNRLWEHISFPWYVAKRKGISLNLCNVAPLISPGIVVIHDVKIKAAPQYFSKIFLLWYNLLLKNETKRAKKIITVSEFSKREICKYYHVKPEKVWVTPDAWQHFERVVCDETALNKYKLKKGEYFFSMSSLEPNKNFKWIEEQSREKTDQIFAIAGSINSRVFADGFGGQCPSNMKLLGYVSDEEAKTLMRDCKAFLFPTHYEGFGIPPLEALSAGASNVVVSDTEVMHEIFESSVLYVNPANAKADWKINGTVSEAARKKVLNKFSWEKSAKYLLKIIME